MNDLLALEPEDNGQEGAFSLQSALKRDSKNQEEGMLDGDMAPVTSEASSGTVVSDGGSAVSGGGDASGQMMQTSVTTPLIVLTTNARGDVEASVLVDPSASMTGAAPWSSLQLSNLHSLAQANLISDTRQEIAKQLSAQGKKGEREGKNSKKQKKEIGGEKHGSKVQFANDLRKDLLRGAKTEVRAVPKKQIAIFEAQPSEPKTFVCQVKGCGRQFAWQAHFKYHQLTHTNDRRFMCDEAGCGKKFLTAQRLQVHKRTHTGERPYVCQEQDCGKSFTTAGNLKNHSRVHTGERPFACEVDGCGRRFAEYSSLHKHSLTHSGDKPFTCEICGKKFSQSGSRRVHVNRHKLDSAKTVAIQEVTGNDLDDNANIDDGDFKTEMSVKVHPDSVLCHPHEDNLQYQAILLTDLQNAESVVFPQGLTDHIVTVTTQPPDPDTETLEMTQDILGAEEVLVEEHMTEPRVGSSVVVLSQPSPIDPLHSSLTHAYPTLHHHHHQKVLTQSVPPVDYDLHPHSIHQEEISTPHSHPHVLTYPSLDPSTQTTHDAQTVAEEIEVSVSSSSSSHAQSGHSIRMDPMMESDDEFDTISKDIS